MCKLYRLRSQPVQAWQYDDYYDMPRWVKMECLVNDGNLILDRRSGRQLVNPGEWLVRDLDGGIVWYSHEEFERTFEAANV